MTIVTLEEAVQKLRTGGDWADLAEAIGVVIGSTDSSMFDIALGLRHGGVVAEQAALALYRKIGKPLPHNHSKLLNDESRWLDLLAGSHSDEAGLSGAGEVPLNGPDESSTPDRRGELRHQLTQLITRALTREERLVLVLYYFEGLTMSQIAATLEMTVTQVQNVHRKTLHRLRERLADDAVPVSKLFHDLQGV